MLQDSWPPLAPLDIQLRQAADGALYLTNGLPLIPGPPTLITRLAHWAATAPTRPFLCQNGRDLTYASVWSAMEAIAARLLPLGLSVDRPLLILAPNGIDHALVMLACLRIGVPAAIVSPACVAPGAEPFRLLHALALLTPGAIYLEGDASARQVAQEAAPGLPILSLPQIGALPPATQAALHAAAAAVGADTIAKFLFTSGSTGHPKAVANTHAMMLANQDGLAQIWPFLRERPPVLVDWLPWNHTFGGNYCFNLALCFGGTFHIDDGKPTPALIGRTVAALRAVSPTLYFNVPAGFAALAPHLQADPDWAARFFNGVEILFNSGAALPAATRAQWQSIAARTASRPPRFVAGWGATELAPSATTVYFATSHAENLGVPMPGVTIKLAPIGDRYELRVRGPNVMRGYWRQAEADSAAFDAEGYYCTGDAGCLADPAHPEQGILFAGRIAENFKLTSGTWVTVGKLRLAIIAAAHHLIADAVITGHGRDEIGALIFPNIAGCREQLGADAAAAPLSQHPGLIAALREALHAHNMTHAGSSTRIVRFAVLDEPPNAAAGEITDKGYINQRATLHRRAPEVAALYESGHEVTPKQQVAA